VFKKKKNKLNIKNINKEIKKKKKKI